MILTKLSLVDLAWASSTCKVFRAVFLRRLAEEQQARCVRAAKCFQQERIDGLAASIHTFLTGGMWEAKIPASPRDIHWWVCESGSLHREARDRSRAGPIHGGDTVVRVRVSYRFGPHMTVEVQAGNGSFVELDICLYTQRTHVNVYPASDDDVEGAALVQALLRGGLAQTLRDAGHSADISIRGFSSNDNFTNAGLKVQLAPLLPYGSYCNEHVWGATVVEESMHVNATLGKGM
jgi:hypothetical protein